MAGIEPELPGILAGPNARKRQIVGRAAIRRLIAATPSMTARSLTEFFEEQMNELDERRRREVARMRREAGEVGRLVRVRPHPVAWDAVYWRLVAFSELHECVPRSPPRLLILAGWAFSSDLDKLQRWEETVAWANANGCGFLLADIPDKDFDFVYEPVSDYAGFPHYPPGT